MNISAYLNPVLARFDAFTKIPTWLSSLIIATVATFGSMLIVVPFGWTSFSPLEIAAVYTSYICTWLCVLQSRWNYPWAVATTLLYCVVFLSAQPTPLLGSALTNIYLPIALIYGWYRWGPDGQTRPVAFLNWSGLNLFKNLAIYGGITAAGIFVVNLALQKFNTSIPAQEAWILGLTILAQFLLDNKKIETWIVWFVIDVIAIWTYFAGNLPLVGVQYVLFLINTVIGFYMWYKSMNIDPIKVRFFRGISLKQTQE